MDNADSFPRISVIIAAYNVQNYIERTIRSALEQRNVQPEIIVADDASTDATAAIVAGLNAPEVKLIHSEQNQGPSHARNKAIAAATAPWLAILDGDDAFAPDRLHRCLSLAKATNADIVIDNLNVYEESTGIQHQMYEPSDFGNSKTLDLATFIARNASFLGGKSLGYVKPIFSKAFLQKHTLSYASEIRIGEDYMLLAEALACGAKCAIDPTSGYLYTVRTGSISHRLSIDDINRMMEGDKIFTSKYKLNPKAEKAQKWRSFSLNEAKAFTRLVNALKQKNTLLVMKISLSHPSSIVHLWRPLVARIKRILNKTGSLRKTDE
jgi:succinoglycan biosynthesis protein ExoO